MTDIYDQHKAAFARVAAYVVLDSKGERVATVAFKYPANGAGRLYAYVHFFGIQMVRGFATGGGYDKATAACQHAASRLAPIDDTDAIPTYNAFRAALAKDGGSYWNNNLEAAGFRVLQAV